MSLRRHEVPGKLLGSLLASYPKPASGLDAIDESVMVDGAIGVAFDSWFDPGP